MVRSVVALVDHPLDGEEAEKGTGEGMAALMGEHPVSAAIKE